jgi:transmembrane sensor
VTLNSRSKVRVEFTASQRTVELLEGQALFRVAKSEGRPFIVRADGTAVQAIGTQFDVNRSHEGTIVTVLEGRVAVVANSERPHGDSSVRPEPGAGASTSTVAPVAGARNVVNGASDGRGASIVLSAGEQVEIDPGAARAASQPKRANVSSATAWTQGQLVLESASLAKVAEEFNRYSARKLVAIDHGASPLHLSGVFATDPDFLIHYLRSRPDIVVRETDTEILIVRNGPP